MPRTNDFVDLSIGQHGTYRYYPPSEPYRSPWPAIVHALPIGIFLWILLFVGAFLAYAYLFAPMLQAWGVRP